VERGKGNYGGKVSKKRRRLRKICKARKVEVVQGDGPIRTG